MRLVEWLSLIVTRLRCRRRLRQANRFYRHGHRKEASELFEGVLRDWPNSYRASYMLGQLRLEEGRHPEALAFFDAAVAMRPKAAAAWTRRGLVLQTMRRPGDALLGYDQALVLEPNSVAAQFGRGTALVSLDRPKDALASFDQTLALSPKLAAAHIARGDILLKLHRPAEALQSYDQAVALDPKWQRGPMGRPAAALHSCNWVRTEALAKSMVEELAHGNLIAEPFTYLAYHDDPALQAECGRLFLRDLFAIPPVRLPQRRPHADGKIRLAYLSADFHDHATAYLIAELIELHDRSRFDVMGVSIGPDYAGAIGNRLTQAFGRIVAVGGMSDWEAAKFIHSLDVDIAVDLKGYTADSRPGIFAHRPVPIQVGYLGYPASMGADFIDYVLADPVVLPFDQQPFYVEKIVHLPHCYQVNDRRKEIAAASPTREAVGLPQQGFVFCCFNNSYKIRAPMFDVWMRLLKAIPGSVLWLYRDNADAEHNLRAEAVRRGVDAGRLIFAPNLPLAEHLARHRLADLFLDTLPVNAHTTASDALWAGLPVLTCQGRGFAGRVAASLLTAAGLPELIATSLDDYEALALKLATHRSLLSTLKKRLKRNRSTCPLFDTPRFARDIEKAYATMWERHQNGLPAESFAVEER